jgi:tetratricopeptide (TPR) repeat protein
VSTATDRAAARYVSGLAASADGHPIVAARQLRAALRHLDGRPPAPALEPTVAELRGRILISLAWVEAERGRLDAGFRLLAEAEPLVPDRLRGLLHGQRGLLLWRGGRHEPAVREYDAAVALLSEQPAPADLVKALSNRGTLHLGAGQIGLARADLRRAAALADRHGLTMLAAVATHNLGDLELLAGDLPTALSTFAGVAAVYEELAPGRLAHLAIDRARALLAAGLFGEADRELATAMAQASARRLSTACARILLARAEAALLAGRPAAARTWAAGARARLLRGQNARRAALADLLALRARFAATANPGTVAGPARRLAGVLNGLGLAEDGLVAGLINVRALIAGERVAEALAVLDGCRRPRGSDRLDTRLLWRLAHAELATASGRPAEAVRHLRAGMASLQRYRSQLGCLDLQTGAAVHGRDLAAAGVSTAVASGSPAKTFRWSELARAQALLVPPVRPPADPRAAAALEELRLVRGALREAELNGAPAGGLRLRSETLQRAIREHAWSATGPGTAARPASMRAVLAELAEAAMVVYLRDGAMLWALVAVDGSARLVALGCRSDAEEPLLRLRADLDAQAGRVLRPRLAEVVAEATRRDAATLAAAVLDPVLGLVGDRDLVVVPTGGLMTVPWAVLPGCVQRPVTVAPSATTWWAARSRREGRPDGQGHGQALLVAGPGNERGEAEVRDIAATLVDAIVLTGPAATPAATLARFGEVTVAHLAAHGRHTTDNPLFSALDLAGGPLMGYDLQRIDRTPPVVVLSSCDLGLTDARPGDETVGMVTALLSAGSSTVVASVSRVADDAAMTVMTDYHRATSRGAPPAAALASAAGPASSFVCFGAG